MYRDSENAVLWTKVDRYLEERFAYEDAVLRGARERSDAAGLPAHNVSAAQGKLLMLLAQLRGATRILEIGTLGGYSTIWLARGLAKGGTLISLERSEQHAAVARENIALAGLADRAEIRVGPALDSLSKIASEGGMPFDLVFIDADKANNAEYCERALRVSRMGTLIVADNVIRGGAVLDENSRDESVVGIRRFDEKIAADARLSATTIQTVGCKGHDGFTLALVTSAP